ncbi:hypothetical protein ACFLXV_04495, partial [Chloroflexota bacterium]
TKWLWRWHHTAGILTVYTTTAGEDAMGTNRRRSDPVNLDDLELEAFNLRFERMSPEDRLRKARELAITFRKHRQPLPDGLADLIRRRKAGTSSPSSK